MASSEDVTKWLRHLLHNLKIKGHNTGVNLLIGDSFHQWVTAPTNESDGFMRHHSELAMGYGMGWFSSLYRGFRRFRHAGSLYAYQSQIWLFPDTQSAVYISTSGPGTAQSQRAVDAILYNVADIILGLHPWVGIHEACAKEENDYKSDETLPYDYEDGYYYNDESDDDMAPMEQRMINYLDNLDTYEGTYGNGYLGNVVIKRNEAGVLGLKLGHNVQGELHPEVEKHRMKFHVKGPLENTVEWSDAKDVEFLLSSLKTEGTSERYYTIRLELQDAHYDFHRGNLFEEMLNKKLELLVKEQRRKAEMEVKAKEESKQRKQEVVTEKPEVTEVMKVEKAGNLAENAVDKETEKDVNSGGEKESAEDKTSSHGVSETNAIMKTNDKSDSKDTKEKEKSKKEKKEGSDSEQHPLNDDNTVESVDGETPMNMKEDSSESQKTRDHYVIEEKERENNLQKEEKPRMEHVKKIDPSDVEEEGGDSERGPRDSGPSMHSAGWMRYCWTFLILFLIKFTVVILEH